jgi:uncharacterized membrane protein YqhA
MLRRILGTSRFLITLAVVGTFITSAMLMVFGLWRAVTLALDVVDLPEGTDVSKILIVDAISIIDIFLIGTVLYIISAGLYQLFLDHRLPLPRWLTIDTLDDLKARLTGVIVVALLVAFLGFVIEWQDDTDILAPGVGIAAIIVAAGLYFRLTHQPGHGRPSYLQAVPRDDHASPTDRGATPES